MIFTLKIAVFVLFLGVAAYASKYDSKSKIESVSVGDFANVVSLQIYGKHFCGGSLINANWILTSAQCVYDMKKEEVSAVAGIVNLNDEGQKRVVKQILIHEDFKFPFDNNIALLRLDTPFELNKNVKIVYLKEGKTEQGTRAIVVGWNGTATNEGASNLEAIIMKTLSDEDCRTAGNEPHPNEKVCAYVGNSEEDGLCLNEIGGPLYDVALSAQIGISSFASSCNFNYPFMYTSVAAYMKWIKTKTNNRVAIVDGIKNKIFDQTVIVNINVDKSTVIMVDSEEMGSKMGSSSESDESNDS